MKRIVERMMQVAAFSVVTLAAGAASAAEPTGMWYDHTGRGAVEITKCGSALCGRVVWVKEGQPRSACGMQILGNVKPVASGVWDGGGWIYDPDRDSKFSVELTLVGAQALKVVGYMGSKMLSETMTWRRAPADLKRCGA